ncbi:MAG: ABC transporter ATP-binding protein [Candidatus Thorarchaeota archaeon]
MRRMEYAIETTDLVKHYKKGKVHAVNGINLKVRKGEIYAFIGANGSGKTTTIDMLSGILIPTSGTIKMWGMNQPKDLKKISPYFGIAPQDYALYMDLTVRENMEFFGKLYRLGSKKIKENTKKLLKILNLEEKEDVLAEYLSGGMKRRLSIACALIHEPMILLFDEATVGVDPILRVYFWDYFRQLRDKGKTILLTSHVMDEAEKADRIGLIRDGKIIEEGTPAELKQRHNVNNIEDIFILLSKGDDKDES